MVLRQNKAEAYCQCLVPYPLPKYLLIFIEQQVGH